MDMVNVCCTVRKQVVYVQKGIMVKIVILDAENATVFVKLIMIQKQLFANAKEVIGVNIAN
tara:strand:- start:376 stop:558 length:183 start_codon:yes stop_codon:yes gene_type:complete